MFAPAPTTAAASPLQRQRQPRRPEGPRQLLPRPTTPARSPRRRQRRRRVRRKSASPVLADVADLQINQQTIDAFTKKNGKTAVTPEQWVGDYYQKLQVGIAGTCLPSQHLLISRAGAGRPTLSVAKYST